MNANLLVTIESWISELEHDSVKQDNSQPGQNVLPTQYPPLTVSLDERPTQPYASRPVAAMQNDRNVDGSNNVLPTTWEGGNHIHDVNGTDGNTQSVNENASSNGQGSVNPSSNNGSPVEPVTSTQSGGKENPAAATTGAIDPGTKTSPSQVGGNQGKGVSEAVPPPGSTANPNSENGGNSGVSGGTSGSVPGGPTNPGQQPGKKL